jgi:hypothetical protein
MLHIIIVIVSQTSILHKWTSFNIIISNIIHNSIFCEATCWHHLVLLYFNIVINLYQSQPNSVFTQLICKVNIWPKFQNRDHTEKMAKSSGIVYMYTCQETILCCWNIINNCKVDVNSALQLYNDTYFNIDSHFWVYFIRQIYIYEEIHTLTASGLYCLNK